MPELWKSQAVMHPRTVERIDDQLTNVSAHALGIYTIAGDQLRVIVSPEQIGLAEAEFCPVGTKKEEK